VIFSDVPNQFMKPLLRFLFVTLTFGFAPLALAQVTLPPATVGEAYSYQVTVTPVPPTASVYSATGLPAGLSINNSSGSIVGIPTTSGLASGSISVTSGSVSNSFNYTLAVSAWQDNPTGGPTGGGNWTVSTTQFLGARFTVTSTANTTAVRATFANASGTMFAAIVPLATLATLPAGAPFNTGEVIVSTTFTVPSGFSNPITVPISATLSPGVYGVIFGSGLFGATGSGSMPPSVTVSGSSSFSRVSPPSTAALWQNNSSSHFKIGLATTPATSSVPVISALSAPRQVVHAGQNLTLAVTAPDAVSYQWKRNGRPIGGATASIYAISSAVHARDAGWYQVAASNSAGSTTSAVIFVNVAANQVVAWGSNSAGQTTVPDGLTSVVSIAAGFSHSLALRADGTVVSWGDNGFGQSSVPVALSDVVAIAAAGAGSLALKSNGTVVGWGSVAIPSGITNAVAIAADYHTLVLKADGTVAAAGSNNFGQIDVPAGLSGVVAIAANSSSSLVLKADGTVQAWGSNIYGQSAVPSGLTDVVAIANADRGYALKSDGIVVNWGAGLNVGQTRMPNGLGGVAGIAARGTGSSVVLTNGFVFTWGASTPPNGLSDVVSLTQGDSHLLALRNTASPIAPAIIFQPTSSSTVAVTGNVTFNTDASGSPAPTFQWQQQAASTSGFSDITNNSTFAGATTKALTVTGPTLAMNGDQFRCVATNSSGNATTQTAVLTVINVPVITTQPVTQPIITGQSASFSVAASFSGALNYTWRRAGFPIPGATNATLPLTNVTRAEADDYDVVIFPTAGGAAVASNPVALRVAPTSYPTRVAPDPAWNLQPENDAASANAILHLADGRAYVSGTFLRAGGLRRTYVMRLNASGAVDPAFEPPEIDSTVTALAVQPDGRLVIVGSFSRVDGVVRSRIARLETDGRVDPGFNVGGDGPSSTPLAVAALTDGNIVLGGGFTSYNGAGVNRLAWLDSRGALLPGTRNDPVGGASAPISVLLALPDGRLLAGGNVTVSNSTVLGGVAILRADGTPDPAFNVGAGGNVGGGVNALALQSDGKLIVGGTFTSFGGVVRNRIARLQANGTLDLTFDPGAGFTNTVRSLRLQTDGKIVVAGSVPFISGSSDSDLTRLLPTGARDAAFVPPLLSSSAAAVAVQNDGRILLAGSFATVGGTPRDGLARLEPDGALDAGFDLALRGSASIGAFALLPNGQVLLARSFAYLRGVAVPARLARFNADGTRDATFNPAGTGADGTILGLVRTPDGQIVIGGSFANYNGAAAGRLARLNADGSRDATYNSGGAGFNSTVNSIAHLGSGVIAAGGVFVSYNGTSRSYLALLDPVGNLLPSFAPVLSGSVSVVVPARDGQMLVAGSFTTVNGSMANRLARISRTGVLDPAFNAGTGSNATIDAVAVLPDNRLLVAGTFTSFNGFARSGLARLNGDGSVDPLFAPAIVGTGVHSLHLQEDGKVIVRGSFSTVGGQPGTTGLARINSDGTVDATFAAGGISSVVLSSSHLMMRDDGSLFVPAGTSLGLQVTRAAAIPFFTTTPVQAKVAQGGSVSFTGAAVSAAPIVYQWFREGVPLVGANHPTLTLTGVTAAQAGHYTLQARSEVGTVMSPGAFLSVRTAPVIMSQFRDRAVGIGGTTSFHIFPDVIGTPSYQWRRNGVVLPAATGASLVIPSVATADAGFYSVVITDASGAITSAPALLTVLPNPLVYSSRQIVAPPGLMAYFAIEGTEPKRLLLRAVGPTLATFGTTGVLADPRITVLRANGTLALANDNWGTGTGVDLTAVFAQVGAFALPAGSKDAVVHGTFAPGSYAVRIEGHNSAPGTALLELFDLDSNPQSRLAYVGVRGSIDSSEFGVIGGLTMTNSTGKRLLIRAIGPGLGGTTALADPRLEVREGSTVVASNNDWNGTSAMSSVAAQAGAFPLANPSADSALLFEQRIGTGAYTAAVLANSGTGEALLEFYDLPASGSSAFAPFVVQPPRGMAVAVGAPLTLRALAVGSGPLAYQWRKHGVPLATANAATLAIAAAQPADAGYYDVVVTNALGSAQSEVAAVGVGNSAAHRVQGSGYVAGSTVTIINTLSYEGTASVVGWDATLPMGWTFVSSTGTANVKPAAGATGLLGWAWDNPPPSPVVFSYTVQAPSNATGSQSVSARTLIRNPDALEPLALPNPLVVPQLLMHSADTDRDFALSLFELTRVIELYNTRNGTVRTGTYRVDPANPEDGFAADPGRTGGSTAVLARNHSADTRGATNGSPRDGAIDLFELTRVIELYNTRAGTVRTGRYHVLEGTEDGFAAGP